MKLVIAALVAFLALAPLSVLAAPPPRVTTRPVSVPRTSRPVTIPRVVSGGRTVSAPRVPARGQYPKPKLNTTYRAPKPLAMRNTGRGTVITTRPVGSAYGYTNTTSFYPSYMPFLWWPMFFAHQEYDEKKINADGTDKGWLDEHGTTLGIALVVAVVAIVAGGIYAASRPYP